jgi:uncharacterized protein
MPSHRDLLTAIRQRPGVDAAIIVGRDGLTVSKDTDDAFPTDDAGARTPQLAAIADSIGEVAALGQLTTAVFEYPAGHMIVSVLSPDVQLVVVTRDPATQGALLYDIRRLREPIAAII